MFKNIVLLQLVWSLSFAQIPDQAKIEADLRIQHGHNTSIVIGLYQNGDFDYYATGLQNRESKTPATTETLYEIGSITKTMTALLLADAVTQNQLQLDDSIGPYWPDTMILQDQNKRPITFVDLATHSSGLYRMPVNFNMFTTDPFANYDTEMLQQAFATNTPNLVGSQYLYSNLGFGLLGETLGRALKGDYEELVQKRVLEPMGLTNTYFHVPLDKQMYLATGYRGNQATSHWNFKALSGAGSLKSDIKDLVKYGVSTLNENPDKLKTALQLTKQQHFSDKGVRVALGWHFSGPGIWHNGGTGGFSTMLMIDPTRNMVAAAMTNNDPNSSVDDIIGYLMDNRQSFSKYKYPVSLSDQELLQIVGTYNTDEQKQLQLVLKDDVLMLKQKFQPSLKLTPINATTFVNDTHGLELTFDEPEQITLRKKLNKKKEIYRKANPQ